MNILSRKRAIILGVGFQDTIELIAIAYPVTLPFNLPFNYPFRIGFIFERVAQTYYLFKNKEL